MDKAEIEKRIRDMAGQGKSYQSIADGLNDEKIPTLSGKGLWNRGTVFKVLKKVSPVQEPDKADPDSHLRKAYQSVLKELDRSMQEIGNLNRTISGMQAEIDTLKTEIKALTQKENYRQKDIDDMLNTALNQNQQSGSDGMLAEILNRLSAIEKRLGMIPKEKQSENIAGWTIQKDRKGFYRAFRHIRGKVRGVYLGKSIADETGIKQKLTTAYQKYAQKEHLLSCANQADGALGNDEDARAAFRQAYDEIGKGRGFVRIHRLRECLNWPREKFDRVLKSLMSGYAVEVHMGDPSILTEKEIQDSFTDENRNLYITLTFWKEPA